MEQIKAVSVAKPLQVSAKNSSVYNGTLKTGLKSDCITFGSRENSQSNHLMGKIIGGAAGLAVASYATNFVKQSVDKAAKINTDGVMKWLKVAAVVINALMTILTILKGSELGNKVENAFRAKFFTNKSK